MGRRVLRRHIWGYSVCLCPIKGTPGLNELSLGREEIETIAYHSGLTSTIHYENVSFSERNEFHFSGVHGAMNRSGSRAK